MSVLKFHRIADRFPLLEKQDPDGWVAFVESIRLHGQREPIVLHEGLILDGRNRYLACKKVGVEPVTIELDADENPWDYVWDENAHRRHLDAGLKAALCVEFQRGAESWASNRARRSAATDEKRKKNPGRPKSGITVSRETDIPKEAPRRERDDVAAAAGVSPATAARVLALESASPELFKKVTTGEVKLGDAIRESKRQRVRAKLEDVSAREVKAAAGLYDAIVIDPPWAMEKIERDERPNQVDFDYPTMSEAALAAMSVPAADDCHVWVWTTQKFLPMALRLLDAWRLKYVCTFVWHKPGGFQPIGLPQYNCEFAIYARRGAPVFLDTKALPTCFEAPRGKHSEKPEAFYDVVRRVTAGRRLDMFNRRQIDGFDTWGNEAPAAGGEATAAE